MPKPVIISVDDGAQVLRAVEPEPKSGLKHQVTLRGMYETGLAVLMPNRAPKGRTTPAQANGLGPRTPSRLAASPERAK